jgi:glycosyltransferase involved in cell wall biosynthesis
MPEGGRPAISVVIPAFNPDRRLLRSLACIAAQDFADYEVVICDDGSSNDEAAAVFAALPAQVTLLRQDNAGPAAARNRAVAAARGTLIFTMDSDDEITPDCLSRLKAALEADPAVGYACSFVELVGERRGVVGWPTNLFELLFSCRPSQSLLLPKALWQALGGQDEAMRHGLEDWEFLLRLARAGYLGKVVPAPLVRYHVSASGHHTRNAMRLLAKNQKYMQEKHADLYSCGSLLKLWWIWRKRPSRRPLLAYFPLRLAQKLLPGSLYTRIMGVVLRARWARAARRQDP